MGHSFFNYRRGMEPVPGYTLIERLGEGGFGEVWRANAPGHIPCAIKIIDLTGREGLLEFKSLKLAKTFDHANVNPITGIWLKDDEGHTLDDSRWSDEGSPVQTPAPAPALEVTQLPPTQANPPRTVELIIAMRLCTMSLHRLLKEYGKLGHVGIVRKELLVYMEDAARAIDYLNSSKSIVHGDIKPQNILISGRGTLEPGTASICDFGLARVVENLQKTQEAPVTVFYAAPEAFKGKAREASDQYSLAVTYVELRTGQLPFPKESLSNFWEVYDAHKQGKLDLAALTTAEADVVRRATVLDPEKRWKNCRELVSKLREACERHGPPLEEIPEIYIPPFVNEEGGNRTPGSNMSTRGGAGSGSSGGVALDSGNAATSFSDSASRGSGSKPGSGSAPPSKSGSGNDSGLGRTREGRPSGIEASHQTVAPLSHARTEYHDHPVAAKTPSTEFPMSRTSAEATPRTPQALVTTPIDVPGVSPAPAPPKAKSRWPLWAGLAGVLAIAVVAAVASLPSGGTGAGGTSDPDSAAQGIRAQIKAGDIAGALDALQQHRAELGSEETPLWRDLEEGWNAATAATLEGNPELAALDQLFETGSRMKRPGLAAGLIKIHERRIDLRFLSGDYSGARLLLTSSDPQVREFLSQADIEQMKDDLSERGMGMLAELLASEKYDDATKAARFLLELRPATEEAKLWLGRAQWHNNVASARETLDAIAADRLPNDEARAVLAVAQRLAAGSAASASTLPEVVAAFAQQTGGAERHAGRWKLTAREGEQLRQINAASLALLTSQVNALMQAGKKTEAVELRRAIAALSPQSDARGQLVDLLLDLKQFPEAATEFKKITLDTAASPADITLHAVRQSLVRLNTDLVNEMPSAAAVDEARKLRLSLPTDSPQLDKLRAALVERQQLVFQRLHTTILAAQKPKPDSVLPLIQLAAAFGEPLDAASKALAAELKLPTPVPFKADDDANSPAPENLRSYVRYVAVLHAAGRLPPQPADWPAMNALADSWKGDEVWLNSERRTELQNALLESFAQQKLALGEVAPRFDVKASPYKNVDQAQYAFDLLSSAYRISGGQLNDPKLLRELALAAWFSKANSAQLTQAVTTSLLKPSTQLAPGDRLWMVGLNLLATTRTAKDGEPAAKEALTAAEQLAAMCGEQYPPGKPQAGLASQLLKEVFTPAWTTLGRPSTDAALSAAQRSVAMSTAEFAWKYRHDPAMLAELRGGGLEPFLGLALGGSAASPRAAWLRGASRLMRADADLEGALADAQRLGSAAASLSDQERAHWNWLRLTALAASNGPLVEAYAKMAQEASTAVEAALQAKTLPSAEVPEALVWQSLARWQERGPNANPTAALASYAKALAAATPDAPLAARDRAQLYSDRARTRAGILRNSRSQLAADAIKAAEQEIADDIAAALKADVQSELGEPRALRAQMLAQNEDTQAAAHAEFLAAVKQSAVRPLEAAVIARQWAALPVLMKPKAGEADAAPPVTEIEALLSLFKAPDAKAAMRFVAAKAHLRRLPADPIFGVAYTGDFDAALVYLAPYTPPMRLDSQAAEWLLTRLAVRRARSNELRHSDLALLGYIVADADLLVSEANLLPAERAQALAARGIAKNHTAFIQVQVQLARSAFGDLGRALADEPKPPVAWRTTYVDSFLQAFETKGGFTADDQQRVQQQIDLAITDLKTAGEQTYAKVIADLEKKRDRVKKAKR